MMKGKIPMFAALALTAGVGFAQQPDNPASPRKITLHEAVQLALQHNHVVRINQYKVQEKQEARQATKSEYFPSIRNDSNFLHLTDTQLIEIYRGSLGGVAATPVPPVNSIINQGGHDLTTSGTQLTQPLTTLLKIHRANEIAQADLKASRSSAQQAENDVALKIHQLYYKILIEQVHRAATEARIKASQDLQSERVEQVKFGSALEENLIES
ncbi:MAG TPA: TolC family protein, partial [Silvibacterium sp.]|nr:TolC family protein [Silvibacterium sp.]